MQICRDLIESESINIASRQGLNSEQTAIEEMIETIINHFLLLANEALEVLHAIPNDGFKGLHRNFPFKTAIRDFKKLNFYDPTYKLYISNLSNYSVSFYVYLIRFELINLHIIREDGSLKAVYDEIKPWQYELNCEYYQSESSQDENIDPGGYSGDVIDFLFKCGKKDFTSLQTLKWRLLSERYRLMFNNL